MIGETLQGDRGAVAHITHAQAADIGFPDQLQIDLVGPAVELLRFDQAAFDQVRGEGAELDHDRNSPSMFMRNCSADMVGR